MTYPFGSKITLAAAAFVAVSTAGSALAGPTVDSIHYCALSSCQMHVWDGPPVYVRYYDNGVQVSSCPCAFDVPGSFGTLHEQKFVPLEIAPAFVTQGGSSTPVDGTYVDSGIVFAPLDEDVIEAERKEAARFEEKQERRKSGGWPPIKALPGVRR